MSRLSSTQTTRRPRARKFSELVMSLAALALTSQFALAQTPPNPTRFVFFKATGAAQAKEAPKSTVRNTASFGGTPGAIPQQRLRASVATANFQLGRGGRGRPRGR